MKLSRRVGRLPERKDWGKTLCVCVCVCVRERERERERTYRKDLKQERDRGQRIREELSALEG